MSINQNPLQQNYEFGFSQFQAYSDTYGLAEQLGYETAQEAWDANPIIQWGVDPRDFCKVRDRGVWDDLTSAGCEIDNHESDLYVADTKAAREIIERFDLKIKTFRNQVDQALWIELPFMFQPFWDAKARVTS